jgi:hypothetical protein
VEALLPYAAWLGSTSFAVAGPPPGVLRAALVRLFGLTLLLGSVFITGLNLLGLFRRETPRRITATFGRFCSPA